MTSDGRWSGGIFTGGDLTKPWTGGMSTIEVIDRMPPGDADLPFGFFTHSLDADDGVAEVTGIEAGGKQALRPRRDGDPRHRGDRPGAPVRRAKPDRLPTRSRPLLRLHRDRDRQRHVRRRAARRASRRNGAGPADQKAGQEDHVTLTPGVAGLKLDPGGAASPATLKLLDRTGKASTQTADVSLPARHGSTESATLSGGSLSLRHAGPGTSVTVTLGALGYGTPASVTTRAIRVGRGQRLTLKPSSWRDLGARVALTVRDAKGRVVQDADGRH